MKPGTVVGHAVEICALDGCHEVTDDDKPLCYGHSRALPKTILTYLMGTWNSYLADPLAAEPRRAHQFALRQATAFFAQGGAPTRAPLRR